MPSLREHEFGLEWTVIVEPLRERRQQRGLSSPCQGPRVPIGTTCTPSLRR
jgi:hypothetical protein